MVNRRFGTAYNTEAPRSSLGMQSPREYLQVVSGAVEGSWGASASASTSPQRGESNYSQFGTAQSPFRL